jgi:4-hydroxybutyrate CoA-transferase
MEKHFHATFMFANREAPNAIAEGRSDFIPSNISEIPKLFLDGIIEIDVAFIKVSEPNAQGYVSFGLAGDNNFALVQSAKWVIAEVNSNMPFSPSATIHVSMIDRFVKSEKPIVELSSPRIDAISEQIGKHISTLVTDGAILQIGFGSVPNATLSHLLDKKDLGIHSELISDGVMHLTKNGSVNSKNHKLHPGKIVTTYIAGTRELYDWVDNNDQILLKPVNYTNDVRIAGQLDNLISINSALQIDLSGQVNAEMIGDMQFSGVGGQSDFVRAALLSPGGKSIIALPSTAKGGTVSRIVPRLDEGACVTTTRHDVQYVVTEYGIVNLRGMCLRERALALIEIAHPDFRDTLRASLKSADQKQFETTK